MKKGTFKEWFSFGGPFESVKIKLGLLALKCLMHNITMVCLVMDDKGKAGARVAAKRFERISTMYNCLLRDKDPKNRGLIYAIVLAVAYQYADDRKIRALFDRSVADIREKAGEWMKKRAADGHVDVGLKDIGDLARKN